MPGDSPLGSPSKKDEKPQEHVKVKLEPQISSTPLVKTDQEKREDQKKG